tara:strand:+ start:284 stop:475 length:192 start_codon:yes stop_codon:yes gene_type:complete
MIININKDFIEGRKASIRECEVGDVYCIESAIMGFIDDPADTEYQKGYLSGLKYFKNKGNNYD